MPSAKTLEKRLTKSGVEVGIFKPWMIVFQSSKNSSEFVVLKDYNNIFQSNIENRFLKPKYHKAYNEKTKSSLSHFTSTNSSEKISNYFSYFFH